jgi:cellulose biosynthesis protein BcsQ
MEIMENKSKTNIISLISGKGGAGKTVIGLSIAKILHEVGFNVLFVDSDFATHGASYFLENELTTDQDYLSFSRLLYLNSKNGKILKTNYGFSFIPSTLNPAETKQNDDHNYRDNLPDIFNDFDFVIFDCQAGYSSLTEYLLRFSQKNLVIMEADAVSSSALRVLYLQLAKYMTNKNTWQIFNKLTEDERKVYGNITDGTFFINLPPVPFDWKVRSAFALGNIPSLFDNDSVFGLAVLRFLKTILKEHKEKLDSIEYKAVGDWYNDLVNKIQELEVRKRQIVEETKLRKRRTYQKQMYLLSVFVGIISILITMSTYFEIKIYTTIIAGIIGVSVSILIPFITNRKLRQDYNVDKSKEYLEDIEKEMNHYKTLVNTDSRLSEYFNKEIRHTTMYKNNSRISE